MHSDLVFHGTRLYFYPDVNVSKISQFKADLCTRHGAVVVAEMEPEVQYILADPEAVDEEFWEMSQKFCLSGTKVLNWDWSSASLASGHTVDIAQYIIASKLNEDAAASATVQTETFDTEDLPPEVFTSCVRGERPSDKKRLRPNSDLEVTQTSVDARDPNDILKDVFSALASSRKAERNVFGSRPYERALSTLNKVSTPILTYEDAIQLPGFSERTARMITDIREGRIAKTLAKLTRVKVDVVKLLATVHGVGEYRAMQLYDRGCRKISDLLPYLDENGRTFIMHYDDFTERIPRSEVEEHYQAVKKLAFSVDNGLQVYCMGSYRRGSQDCGDIDIILTAAAATSYQLQGTLTLLLDRMVSEHLALYTFSKGPTKWLGATQTRSKWRRMDILVVPWEELGAATLYYTGCGEFNRQMRLIAMKDGMKLNQSGLYKKLDNDSYELVESFNEHKIFTHLRIPWLEPENRIMAKSDSWFSKTGSSPRPYNNHPIR